MEEKKIVCLGGGIGTVNLIKGLKSHTKDISVIVSVADDGGSSGRLRRLYNILPPGDIISCIAALSDNQEFADLLTYRFPGARYGGENTLSGHKIGNLLMVAARDITGDFAKAIELVKKLAGVQAALIPSTLEMLAISAVTSDGVTVEGEEKIDLGNYSGERVLERIALHPSNPTPAPGVMDALERADAIVVGPGDLYTTLLPVLLIPEIASFLRSTQKPKVFIVNVANKPFETKGYSVSDFINAITKHLGEYPFSKTIINNDFSIPIPKKYHYTYVSIPDNFESTDTQSAMLLTDLVDKDFPLYHNSEKLASFLYKNI